MGVIRYIERRDVSGECVNRTGITKEGITKNVLEWQAYGKRERQC